jgi:hypothetical protein
VRAPRLRIDIDSPNLWTLVIENDVLLLLPKKSRAQVPPRHVSPG